VAEQGDDKIEDGHSSRKGGKARPGRDLPALDEFLAVRHANPRMMSAAARAILPQQTVAKAIFNARAAPEPFERPFPVF